MSFIKVESPLPVKEDELLCRREGCKNRWAVQREGFPPLCSAHAWSEKTDDHKRSDDAKHVAEALP